MTPVRLLATAALLLAATAPSHAQMFGFEGSSVAPSQSAYATSNAGFAAPSTGAKTPQQIAALDMNQLNEWIAAYSPVEGPTSRQRFGVVSHGQDFEWTQYSVPGHVTIFDFWGSFCGPCRAKAPAIAALSSRSVTLSDGKAYPIAVRMVDLSDGSSAAAKHYFPIIKGLPYLAITGPDGTLLTQGKAASDLLFTPQTGWVARLAGAQYLPGHKPQ